MKRSPEITTTLPVLPIRSTVVFPGSLVPLVVGREGSVAAVKAASESETKKIFIVAQREADDESPGRDDLYAIGTIAVVKNIARSSHGL